MNCDYCHSQIFDVEEMIVEPETNKVFHPSCARKIMSDDAWVSLTGSD